ncbi:ASKHA domain-containing protein [Rhodovulum sp. DZ06]|uniref:ASKHA domain-containing protein n=1 Tax=Rhodovulum sp. DZ06 TaxID=3425126 RepID=UPI003D3533D1
MTDQSQDPLVIFTPSGKRGRVARGTKVLDAARRFGVDLDSVCGGRGICSKCQCEPGVGDFPKHGLHVEADALSPVNAVEERYDRIRGLKPGRRLGCQAEIQGDCVIDVPPESQVHKQVVRKRAEVRAVEVNPVVRRYLVVVEEPNMHEPSGDLERLQDALAAQWGVHGARCPLAILTRLQPVLREGNWQVTVTVHDASEDGTAPVIIDIAPGFDETPPLGLAFDLGSTTIACHLCDLATGDVLASGGRMNPQIRYGEDLMSRVSYSMMNEGGAAEMTRAVRDALGALIEEVCAEAGAAPAAVHDAVFVCNPVMHHLLLGVDPKELGWAPFALATSDAVALEARDLGLPMAAAGRVHILPCVAGHVGADAAAVVLSEAPQEADKLTLIVDVGTNAEIVLGDKDGLMACSSPTGPAFEGAQISSGQRAAPGAIERIRIDPVTKLARFRVIGSELWSDEDGFDHGAVTGICGSGIIEAVAEMRLAGIIDEDGAVGSAEQIGLPVTIPEGRTHAYVVHDGRAAGGPLITVTQGDVRAIQLAKAALMAGARLLMDRRGVDAVERVVLAGAFGAHISPMHAMVLGMIPDCPLDQVVSAGNAAGTGARIALVDKTARAEIQSTVRRIEKVETAVEPRFQEHFVDAIAVPHKTAVFKALEGVAEIPAVKFGGSDGGEGGGRRGRRRRG